jgi:NhaA family Na+:H+ antiporter
LIIAIFFTSDLKVEWLIVAVAIAFAHYLTERVQKLPHNVIRVISFVLLWYAVLQSGVHATIAGVALGLLIPAKKTHGLVAKIQPWTNSAVLPLFAFFSVAILLPSFSGSFSSVFIGIAIALPVGKIVGITLFAALANRIAKPEARLDLHSLDFVAIAALAGVGFTVSLLMTNLAFKGSEQILAEATLAVILGSIASMTVGAWLAQSRAKFYRTHKVD